MKIAVIGTGYVGLVTGTCLSDIGHKVTCIDIDREKITKLNKGISPIYEPGLEKIIKENMKAKRLSFSTDLENAVKENEIIFIAVGTPQDNDGSADLKYVKNVAEDIAKHMHPSDKERIIVIKSTVPVGTAGEIEKIVSEKSDAKFSVASNPEFLREGTAIYDFMKPDRVVIGAKEKKTAEKMNAIYKKLKCKILNTDNRSAELIKYASNTFLAAKISFINEMANLCDRCGANITNVSAGMGLDKRIGKYFLHAGCGYGGSCFPKDVKALIHIGKQYGLDLKIAKAAEEINEKQKILVVEKAEKELGNLNGKIVALLGLAFKPNTDDIREASSLEIIKELLGKGAIIKAYDPIAEENVKKIYPNIEFCKSAYEALSNSGIMLLVTEWDDFKKLDFKKVKKLMKNPVIIDGRNIYDGKKLRALGFKYFGIGVISRDKNNGINLSLDSYQKTFKKIP
ncbi:MAG: UDP-glucose/GDP-mannose dehydrogenase family protein [archaeon]